MTDIGTQFPRMLTGIVEMVTIVEEKFDGDIYEVKVELDNGAWRVDVFYTDDDLASHKLVGYMETYGGIRWEKEPVDA